MQVKVLQNAPREHSAILSTFVELPFVFKTFDFSIFEWPLKTGFTVSYTTLENLCTRKVKSSRGGYSQRVHKINSVPSCLKG